MRDYITTVFNLIVGLVNADKIVYLALIGLGVILVWQLLSLLTSFHRRFACKCRKLSKFLISNGLSANNYNRFLALVAKMPQEFIRGYKTFEHASYGLPSDYIKRFDSIDVEVNGGILNHGKSMVKAVIYGWTVILSILSLALIGDTPLTGLGVADALLVPVLFLILAKGIYFIFNAIKQQQYKMAVDEFNEMLDLMDEKIENNDNMPGPDVLANLIESVPVLDDRAVTKELSEPDKIDVSEIQEPLPKVEPAIYNHPDTTNDQAISEEGVYTEEDLISEVEQIEEYSDLEIVDDDFMQEDSKQPTEQTQVTENTNNILSDLELNHTAAISKSNEESIITKKLKEYKDYTKTKTTTEDIEMEEKRGRGRPRKIEEGELVIKNDKQFEEVLLRAEKLMRKSEEALSSSQAKRVEKSLKELIDAMTKYKEEH